MTNLEIARRFAGMTGKDLAAAVGVSPQQMTNWMTGIRTPGRAAAEKLAEVLDVDAEWVLGLGQKLALADPLEGKVFECGIIRTEHIDGYGALYHVWLEETGDVVPVILGGGVQLTPWDWQALTVRSAEDIAGERWMDARGHEAIMLDGLPRAFA